MMYYFFIFRFSVIFCCVYLACVSLILFCKLKIYIFNRNFNMWLYDYCYDWVYFLFTTLFVVCEAMSRLQFFPSWVLLYNGQYLKYYLIFVYHAID